MRAIEFRGKSLQTGEWVYGDLLKYADGAQIWYDTENGKWNCQVDPKTVGQCTGLKDKEGNKIYTGDITSLVVDGAERRFIVDIETVVRDFVNHPGFYDAISKVAVTAVTFTWNGFKLFPCVDKNGTSDTKLMTITGNIHDNPELLEVE